MARKSGSDDDFIEKDTKQLGRTKAKNCEDFSLFPVLLYARIIFTNK